MSILRCIYDHSPISFQNLMTSVYGYRLHALRYGGSYQKYLAEIEKSQWLSTEEIREIQFGYLKDLLEHAYEQTDFYCERFKEAGFHPEDLKSVADLQQIQTLSREDILQNADRMVARDFARNQLIEHFTSGTTGTPLRFYLTRDTFRRNYAFWTRFRRWFGFKEWSPRATFGGRVVVPRSQVAPPFWRYNRVENQMVFSSFHLSDETAPYYIEELERFSPFLIDGYVSSIYTLARFINREGITSVRPAAVQTTSETLFQTHCREIERAFQCKLYNQYSHGENAVFITECEEGSLHVNDEYGVVEILRNSRPAKAGEVGELVVTGFNNWAMPLIRYRTGDLAVPSAVSSCSCGRGLSLVSSIEGRVLDILRMADGKIVPPTALTLLFDKAQAMGIDQAQIIQEAPDLVVVKLVLRDLEDSFDTAPLEQDLRSMMGSEVSIEFETVDHIPKTDGGKFKFVTSEIDPWN